MCEEKSWTKLATESGDNGVNRLQDSVVPPPQETIPEFVTQPQAEPRREKIEHVYIWDCFRFFCISHNRTMNRVIRVLLIFFNILLFVSSILRQLCPVWLILLQMFAATILGIGIWLIADPKSYEPSRFLDTYNVIHASYIMIISSGITLVLLFFGIGAILLENIYMIIIVSGLSKICFFPKRISLIILCI